MLQKKAGLKVVSFAFRKGWKKSWCSLYLFLLLFWTEGNDTKRVKGEKEEEEKTIFMPEPAPAWSPEPEIPGEGKGKNKKEKVK